MAGFGKKNSKDSIHLKKSKKYDDSNSLSLKLKEAKHHLDSGNEKYAENIYSQLLNNGCEAYELFFSFALLCRNKLNFQFSKVLLKRSINKYPTKADQYILLAEINRIEKNFSRAEELLFVARRINPRNGNTFYNLSLLYRELGSLGKALENVEISIKYNPNNYIYKLLKADLLKDNNNFGEAKTILKELNSNKNIKDKKDILLLLSTVERLDSEFFNAEKILLEIIIKYPSFSNAYLNLSDLYFDMKMSKEAKETILNGIRLNPNNPELYVNLGIISRNLGQISEAKKYLLKALSMNKNLFKCYMNLSTFYDFSDHPIELKHLLKIPLKNLQEEDVIRVLFSRGNIYHSQGNYDAASQNYQLANNLKRRIFPSNKEFILDQCNEIYKSYFSQDLEELSSFSCPELIFILGMPRSGSTLLENILSLNNEVTDLGETNILPKIMSSLSTGNKTVNPYKLYLEETYKVNENLKITTDKNLFNYMFCPVINKYFENSKLILCLRNPLDNILSIFRSNFNKVNFSTSLEDITEVYIHHYELMKIYSKTYKKQLFIYYYDELVKNPSVEIKKIIDWLGWEWSDKYLSPHKNKRSVFTASSEQVRNPIHKKSLKGWEKYRDLLKPAITLLSNNPDLKNYI